MSLRSAATWVPGTSVRLVAFPYAPGNKAIPEAHADQGLSSGSGDDSDSNSDSIASDGRRISSNNRKLKLHWHPAIACDQALLEGKAVPNRGVWWKSPGLVVLQEHLDKLEHQCQLFLDPDKEVEEGSDYKLKKHKRKSLPKKGPGRGDVEKAQRTVDEWIERHMGPRVLGVVVGLRHILRVSIQHV